MCINTSLFHTNSCVQVATGGELLAVESNIDTELKQLSSQQIKPVFIFGGLTQAPHANTRPPQTDKFSGKRHQAWESYEKGNTKTAAYLFAQTGGYVSLNMQTSIIDCLTNRDITCFRAPYSCAGQLAYLNDSSQRYIHAACGGLELLLFGIDRLITHLDFEKQSVTWVDREEVLSELSLSQDQFLDMCLLAGYGRCRSFPLVMNEKGRFTFKTAYDLVVKNDSGEGVITAHMQDPKVTAHVSAEKYSGMFNNARRLIANAAILTPGCTKTTLKENDNNDDNKNSTIDTDSTAIKDKNIIEHIPKEIFLLLSKGVCSPQVINTIINGALTDAPPLIDSEEYVSFLDQLAPFRWTTIDMVASALKHPVKVVNRRWYQADTDIELGTTQTQENKDNGDNVNSGAKEFANANAKAVSPVTLSSWHISKEAVAAALQSSGEQTLEQGGVLSPLRWLINQSSSSQTPTASSAVANDDASSSPSQPTPPSTSSSSSDTTPSSSSFFLQDTNKPLASVDEIVSSCLFQILRATCLVNDDDVGVCPEVTGIWADQTGSFAAFDTPLFYTIMLLRSGALKSKRMSIILPDGESAVSLRGSQGINVNIRDILLISRVFSLLPLRTNSQAWTGLIDRDLSSFNAITNALHRTMRDLSENIILSLFASQSVDISALTPTDFIRLRNLLPFTEAPSTVMGVVAMHFMLGKSLAELQTLNPQATHIVDDLKQCLTFWQLVMKVVRERQHVDSDAFADFISADMFLQAFMTSHPIA